MQLSNDKEEFKAMDFKAVAGKNAAAEFRALSEKLEDCCEITEGESGETLFDGFDLREWAVGQFEEIARRYASMPDPGPDDGIFYVRKSMTRDFRVEEIVEYSNGRTSGHVNVVLLEDDFEKAGNDDGKFFIVSGAHYNPADKDDGGIDVISWKTDTRREAAGFIRDILRDTFKGCYEFTVDDCMYGNFYCNYGGEWVKLAIAEYSK